MSQENRKVILTPEEYEQRYGELNRKKERDKNIQLLLKIRPGIFTLEEQQGYEVVKEGISFTAWFALAGFLSTSAFRYWQLRQNNKSVLIGFTSIMASYAPAMIYYKQQVTKETTFVREISEKYKDKIDDGKLSNFVQTLPKEDSYFSYNKENKEN